MRILFLETNFLFNANDVLDKDYALCRQILEEAERKVIHLIIPELAFLEVDHVFEEKVKSRIDRFKNVQKQVTLGKESGLSYPPDFNLRDLKTVFDMAVEPLRTHANLDRIRKVCEVIPLASANESSYLPIITAVSVLTRRSLNNGEGVSAADQAILAHVLDCYTRKYGGKDAMFCTRDAVLIREAQRCVGIASPALILSSRFGDAIGWVKEVGPSSPQHA